MSTLSLRSKTVIFGVTILLVALIAAKVLLQQKLSGAFAVAERNAVARKAQRGKALIDNTTEQIDRLTRDWAHWDDMYAFMQNRNEAFRRSNLQASALRDLQLHQVLLLTPAGKLIYSNCFAPDWQPCTTPPAALLAQLAPKGPLLGERPRHGLLATADGPLLVASWPILHGDGSGLRRGTLIFGRFLGQAELARLAKLGNLHLQVIPLSRMPAAAPGTIIPHGSVLVTPVNPTQVIGYLPLNDLAGTEELALEVTSGRELYLQGQKEIGEFGKTLLLVFGLWGLLLLLGLEFLVLRRVARAATALEHVAATGDLGARVPEEGQDELGRLIQGINDALAAIDANVAKQQTAAREREHLQQLLDSVIAYTPLPLFVKEFPSGRYIIWNQAAEQLFGRPADEVLGKDDYQLFSQEHADEFRTREQAAIETGKVFDALEEAVLTPAGESHILHLREVPLPSFEAAEGYVVCIAEDVTEHREQQAQLQRTLEELAKSNTELEQFAYVASHDLQEPLRMVASYVQLLARRYQGKLDADADDFIGFAVDGATRMQGLINDLLAYSRVGTQGEEFKPLPLEKALGTALNNLQVALAENAAEVTHEPLPQVFGDEGQLVQLLQNLVANALKFRREETPRIHVSVRQEGEEAVIGVRDNGIGIEPQYVHRIFIIFQRLYTRQQYAGTGIGLAICKRIVERHGGRIWVESTPAEGSTFCFTLPQHMED